VMALSGTIILDLCLVIIFLFVFSVLRRTFPSFYSYKSFENESWAPQYHKGFLSWIVDTWRLEDKVILQQPGGYDAFSFLQFIRYAIKLFTFISFIGLVAVLWTNWSGANQQLAGSDPNATNGFAAWTMANLPNSDNRFSVHTVTVIIFNFAVWYMMHKLYQNFSLVNHERLKNESLTARSVVVFNVPKAVKTDDQLLKTFEEQYYGRMTDAVVVKDTSKLRALYQKRKNYFELWKKNKYLEAHTGERTTVVVPKLGMPVGETCDAIHFYERKLKKYDALLKTAASKVFISHKEYQHSGLSPSPARKSASAQTLEAVTNVAESSKQAFNKARSLLKLDSAGVGFISFDSLAVAMQAAQTLQLADPSKLVVKLAPDASDIQWQWLCKPAREIWLRYLLVLGLNHQEKIDQKTPISMLYCFLRCFGQVLFWFSLLFGPFP